MPCGMHRHRVPETTDGAAPVRHRLLPIPQAPGMSHRRCRMLTELPDPDQPALLSKTSALCPSVDLKHVTAPPAGEEGEAAAELGLAVLREPPDRRVTRVSVDALCFGGCCLDAAVRNLRGQRLRLRTPPRRDRRCRLHWFHPQQALRRLHPPRLDSQSHRVRLPRQNRASTHVECHPRTRRLHPDSVLRRPRPRPLPSHAQVARPSHRPNHRMTHPPRQPA